jgi:zinc transporter ZupT
MLCLLNNIVNKAGSTGPSNIRTLTTVQSCSQMPQKKDLGKLQLAQRANINNIHVNLSWLKVEDRLTSSLLVFIRGIDMLNALSGLSKLLAHSSDTHAYPTRHEVSSPVQVQNRRWEAHSTV